MVKKYSAYPAEWYPVLQLAPENYLRERKSAEFSDAEVARVKAAGEEFCAVQQMIYNKFGFGPVSWDGGLFIEDHSVDRS